jgi:branched-chain amino acid transport system ATP-binding protein
MSADHIEVRDLAVSYGPIAALNGVSLRVQKGEVVAILGANGVGKSTLLKTISGLVRVASGKVLLNGKDITNQRPHQIARRGIAHVPEGRRIIATLTVEENIRLTYGTTGARRGRAWSTTLEEIYGIFPRLAERRKVPGSVLSGGEQQMLAISRALAADPEFLLLDEPSMGLAPVAIDQIYQLLDPSGAITKNRGVLLAEQSASLALSVASYAMVLVKGSIVLEGKTDSIASSEMVAAYLGGEEPRADTDINGKSNRPAYGPGGADA